MNTLLLPRTDAERIEALSHLYIKGIATPKNELVFSADSVVYLKPFITKLQQMMQDAEVCPASLAMVRAVVDGLIKDIMEEVQAMCLRMGGKRGEHLANEYGLHFAYNPFEADFFYSRKVA